MYAEASEIAYMNITTALSIKCAFGGQEIYEMGEAPLAVDDSSFLVVNDQHTYSSYIQSHNTVSSFCLFFQKGLAESVYNDLISGEEHGLDNPGHIRSHSIDFIEQFYRHDQSITPLIMAAKNALMSDALDQFWIDEHFYRIMEQLLKLNIESSKEADALPYAKKSTRLELYKRIQRARNYIDSCIGEHLSLKQIARTACLSEYHFLRAFKQVTGATPNQYITIQRLSKAKHLLKDHNQSIREVCLTVGFLNESSFTRLFKSYFGVTPSQYRAGND